MAMVNKYAGHCTRCGASVPAGQGEAYKEDGRWQVRHQGECPTRAEAPAGSEAPAEAQGAIHLSGGSGYGCQGWHVGQVILSGEKRRREGGPDGMVVVSAKKHYYREEGMSFGVGDEQGYAYSATARPATRGELAPAIEEAHEEALQLERELEVKRLAELFRTQGQCPPGRIVLQGEEVPLSGCDTRLYGGGTWAVVEPAGPRTPPDPKELALLSAEVEARKAALARATAARDAHTRAHLPPDAPFYRSNPAWLRDGKVRAE